MAKDITVTMDIHLWQEVQGACYRQAGEIAAREAQRTGGRGFASGGALHGVEQLHKAQDIIMAARDEQDV